jgi:mycofactocin glycosyltransferase
MNVAVRRNAAIEIGGWDETMPSGEDVDFAIRLRKKYGAPIRYVDQGVIFHRLRRTDEALWKQARWHGQGYALVHQRHSDTLSSPAWRSGIALVIVAALHALAPLVEIGCALRLVSAERAEFERYHRRWLRHFWSGFVAQWRKGAA